MFTSSTKREIRHFHVVVVQGRQRNAQKSVMHVQSCCFANLNLLLFWPFSLTSPSSLLKLPRIHKCVWLWIQFFLYLQTTVVKKKMYYNMRVKTLQRNKADLLFRLETEKAVLQAEPKNRIHKLYSAVKDVSTGLVVILQS